MASQRPEIYEDLKQMADYSFGQFVKQTVLDKHSWHQVTYIIASLKKCRSDA